MVGFVRACTACTRKYPLAHKRRRYPTRQLCFFDGARWCPIGPSCGDGIAGSGMRYSASGSVSICAALRSCLACAPGCWNGLRRRRYLGFWQFALLRADRCLWRRPMAGGGRYPAKPPNGSCHRALLLSCRIDWLSVLSTTQAWHFLALVAEDSASQVSARRRSMVRPCLVRHLPKAALRISLHRLV